LSGDKSREPLERRFSHPSSVYRDEQSERADEDRPPIVLEFKRFPLADRRAPDLTEEQP